MVFLLKNLKNKDKTSNSIKNPLDFSLWLTNSKFKNQVMQWYLFFYRGFPGWHTECLSIAYKYLGQNIDFHLGGLDHITIHNKNEYVQAQSIFNNKWVNKWIHSNFLLVNNNKMGKSKNNYILLNRIYKFGYNSLHFRYLCMNSKYESFLIFTWIKLKNTKHIYYKLYNMVIHVLGYKKKLLIFSIFQSKYYKRLILSIGNNFHTPKIIELIWKICKDSTISRYYKVIIIKICNTMLALTLIKCKSPFVSHKYLSLMKKRYNIRKKHLWIKADIIREKLIKHNILLEDFKYTTKWYNT